MSEESLLYYQPPGTVTVRPLPRLEPTKPKPLPRGSGYAHWLAWMAALDAWRQVLQEEMQGWKDITDPGSPEPVLDPEEQEAVKSAISGAKVKCLECVERMKTACGQCRKTAEARRKREGFPDNQKEKRRWRMKSSRRN